MSNTVYNFPQTGDGQPVLQSQFADEKLTVADKILKNSVIMHRPSFAHVQVNLDNQTIIANAGNMLWMDSKVNLTTGCHGGCCAAYWRHCALENPCQNIYSGSGEVALGFELPGDILPFAVAPGNGWYLSQGSFVCSTDNVVISGKFPGCAVCCCAGEGPFLVQAYSTNGTGVLFAGNYGAIQRHEIPAGKRFCVSRGLFFACSDQTQIHIGLAGGLKNCCCGGEGIVMKFTGPCVVYTQNRDPAIMYALLNPKPKQQGKNNNPSSAGN